MAAKYKVLIYSDCYLYGGSEKVILNIFRNPTIREYAEIRFAYRRHKIYDENLVKDYTIEEKFKFLIPVSILTNDSLFYHIYLKKIPGILKKLIRIPFVLLAKSGLYNLFNFISLVLILKKIKPDIVHINNGGYPAARSCNIMVLASKFCKIRSIIYQVNNIAEIQRGFFDKKADKYINRNVCAFITASKEARLKLSTARNFEIDKIRNIPNTIPEESITLSREMIIDELKLGQNDFIICNVALLTKRKGQKFLLEALDIIKNSDPIAFKTIRLLIIGNGEEEHNLKSIAEGFGILQNVFFMGYRNDSINFINICDIFILPSIANEDMPLSILTAMSLGKNIVATDFGGIREEIEDRVSGILVTQNLETLSMNIAKAILDIFYGKNTSYGKNAKKRFIDLFSPEKFGHSIVDIYEEVITV